MNKILTILALITVMFGNVVHAKEGSQQIPDWVRGGTPPIQLKAATPISIKGPSTTPKLFSGPLFDGSGHLMLAGSNPGPQPSSGITCPCDCTCPKNANGTCNVACLIGHMDGTVNNQVR